MNADNDALRRRIEELESELGEIRLERQHLKKSEQFLQSILNTTSNRIASYEAIRTPEGRVSDFRIVYTNVDAFSKAGEQSRNIVGKTCKEVYPGIFRNGVFERLVKCITTGQPDTYQVDYIRNGEIYWFDASIEKLNDSVTVTARDITEELKAELRLKDLNRLLKIQNTVFKHSEENAEMGSYAWNMTTNELECSDNLYRMIGHAPQDFIPSFEQFLSFLHPDDRHKAMRDSLKAYETRVLVKNTYRVISADGEMKFLRLSGNFIHEGDTHFMIGALQNVSKDVRLNEALRVKNVELRRNNEELASFSYVASHDLQEPLRKIRAFSGRIMEKDGAGFSESTRDYFSRIVSSATRMQKLIDALLSYSSTNAAETEFVMTNLNTVVEEVRNDLEGRIEESRAVFRVGDLPTLPAIPVQVQQLMQNIISNSLKYTHPDRQPVVIITSERTEDPIDKREFYKITVTDNGIGFEQQFENRIFDLFQRLHGRQEYEGTGIGLAICKKIVENHQKHISAEGNPGKGATFRIFLPVNQQFYRQEHI